MQNNYIIVLDNADILLRKYPELTEPIMLDIAHSEHIYILVGRAISLDTGPASVIYIYIFGKKINDYSLIIV